ncbi:MAG: GIY-YIG nuclease family protein [Gammaproteobacteria bacterium]|nr:GIY-YIG nuclease family protein [Gammaproteobacteria bacterium]
MLREPCVYILANQKNGTLYTGVTSNLRVRVWQHKEKILPGFTSTYGVNQLMWFETHESMDSAISREKQLKAGSRQKKLELIEQLNPRWDDLFHTLG